MATTYTLISSVTVGSGGAANIEFTSIPATYTDLLLKTSVRSNRSATDDSLFVKFNGSTSNFSGIRLYGQGSSVASDTQSPGISQPPAASATANTFSNGELYIPNYTGSTAKSFSVDGVGEDNISTPVYATLFGHLWNSTSAITSITIYSGTSNNLVQYSTAYLYGISNS
jgi:hypothetical protein